MTLVIIYLILAFLLVLCLPYVKDKLARWSAILWICIDVIEAMIRLSDYYKR